MKKIAGKINEIHTRLTNDPVGTANMANDLQKLAAQAALGGIKSRAWEQYMRKFASNKDQLKRLIGEDTNFNDNAPWAAESLAYIVANSTCGVDTATHTINNMPVDWVENLDRNLRDDEEPEFA